MAEGALARRRAPGSARPQPAKLAFSQASPRSSRRRRSEHEPHSVLYCRSVTIDICTELLFQQGLFTEAWVYNELLNVGPIAASRESIETTTRCNASRVGSCLGASRGDGATRAPPPRRGDGGGGEGNKLCDQPASRYSSTTT